MKQKIKEALQQGFKNLGLKDEVLERVAASVETFISDESEIQKFVESELVKNLMKFEQADADRKRTKREKDTKVEGEKAAEEGEKTEVEQGEKKESEAPAWAKQLIEQNQALAKQNETLAADIAAFKAAQAEKNASAALDTLRNSWDYAKSYPEESNYAYEMATGIYNGIGKTWSADELTAKYKEIFNERVSKKGVDTSKPFKSEGSADAESSFDSDYFTKLYKDKIAKSDNQQKEN